MLRSSPRESWPVASQACLGNAGERSRPLSASPAAHGPLQGIAGGGGGGDHNTVLPGNGGMVWGGGGESSAGFSLNLNGKGSETGFFYFCETAK